MAWVSGEYWLKQAPSSKIYLKLNIHLFDVANTTNALHM